MSVQILHAPLGTVILEAARLGPTSRYILETREELLAYETEELAALRFSIILTARWESSGGEDAEHRADLREDLEILRNHYGDKLDELAMTFGIDQAVKIKEHIERTVIVPREYIPSTEASQNSNAPCRRPKSFEEFLSEGDGGECGI